MNRSAPAVPDRRLDGNALAGPLLQLFTVDLAGAMGTCAHCARTAPLGEQQLYTDAPAFVLRCRDCDNVLLRYSDAGGAFRADLSGLTLILAQEEEPGPSADDLGPRS